MALKFKDVRDAIARSHYDMAVSPARKVILPGGKTAVGVIVAKKHDQYAWAYAGNARIAMRGVSCTASDIDRVREWEAY